MTTISLERAAPGLFQRLRAQLHTFFVMRAKRKRFNNLLNLDDRMLEDIGVTRAEVLSASRLPIAQNAARALDRMANDRRRLDRLNFNA